MTEKMLDEYVTKVKADGLIEELVDGWTIIYMGGPVDKNDLIHKAPLYQWKHPRKILDF